MCTRSSISCVWGATLYDPQGLVWKLRGGVEGDTHWYLVCSSEVPQLGIFIVPLWRRSGFSLSLASNPRTFKPTLAELLSLNTCLSLARSPVHEATQYASGFVDQRSCARAMSSTRRRNMARHHWRETGSETTEEPSSRQPRLYGGALYVVE